MKYILSHPKTMPRKQIFEKLNFCVSNTHDLNTDFHSDPGFPLQKQKKKISQKKITFLSHKLL